jgi:quinohemoprotein ethanol dehydrogenase
MAPAIGRGTVTTGGNLVFHVIPDGRFVAYGADKGEKLFEVKTGRVGMAPPITYEIDGKQYLAFMGGAGTLGPVNEKVDNPPLLFVSALDGKAGLPTPARRQRQTPLPRRERIRPLAHANLEIRGRRGFADPFVWW